MVQIRTDMGTIGSEGDLGSPARAAAMTAEDVTALSAEPAVAASGGAGATAGAFNAASDRDAAIVTINDNRTRIGELDVLQVKILARIKEIENALENIGLVAKN